MIGLMNVMVCLVILINVPSVVLPVHIDLDKKKAAYERRKAKNKLNRMVAKLSVSDILYLEELASRLVKRAAKVVLPNILEELENG